MPDFEDASRMLRAAQAAVAEQPLVLAVIAVVGMDDENVRRGIRMAPGERMLRHKPADERLPDLAERRFLERSAAVPQQAVDIFREQMAGRHMVRHLERRIELLGGMSGKTVKPREPRPRIRSPQIGANPEVPPVLHGSAQRRRELQRLERFLHHLRTDRHAGAGAGVEGHGKHMLADQRQPAGVNAHVLRQRLHMPHPPCNRFQNRFPRFRQRQPVGLRPVRMPAVLAVLGHVDLQMFRLVVQQPDQPAGAQRVPDRAVRHVVPVRARHPGAVDVAVFVTQHEVDAGFPQVGQHGRLGVPAGKRVMDIELRSELLEHLNVCLRLRAVVLARHDGSGSRPHHLVGFIPGPRVLPRHDRPLQAQLRPSDLHALIPLREVGRP